MNPENQIESVNVSNPSTETQSVKIERPSRKTSIVPSVKMKRKIVWYDGCLVGRMSLLRKCVDKNLSAEQTLDKVRRKYPHGLCGTRAIRWIQNEMDKYRKRLAKQNPETSKRKTRKTRKTSIASNVPQSSNVPETTSNVPDASNVTT